jgi:hypothetical protein
LASDDQPICRGDWHPHSSSRSVRAWLLAKDGEIAAVAEEGDAGLASAAFPDLDVSPRVGSIPRRIEFPDGSLFETTDNDAIDRLLRAKGRRRAGLVHALERFHPRLLLFVAAVFLLSGLVYRYALPVLVEVAVAVTPPVVPRLMSVSTLETLDRTVLDETKLDGKKGRDFRRFRPYRGTVRAWRFRLYVELPGRWRDRSECLRATGRNADHHR